MRVPGARLIPPPIMLFKFTTPDMLNASLIDVVTGNLSFEIATVAVPVDEVQQCESIKEESICLAPSVVAFQPPCNGPSSSKSSLTTKACSVAVVKQSHWEESGTSPSEARRTTIKDTTGTVVADIVWNGRRPSITICDEKVGGLTDLFGSTTVRFMPKILAIPTRFDTEYVWTATAESLTLFDYYTESVKGTFHQNVVRIPARSKGSKDNISLPPGSKLSSAAKNFPPPTSPLPSSETLEHRKDLKSTFIPAHFPGLGSNYLEFASHPLAHDVEFIVSFLMMEILRRGRFNLTPYNFEKPKVWHFRDAKDLILSRLRRHSV